MDKINLSKITEVKFPVRMIFVRVLFIFIMLVMLRHAAWFFSLFEPAAESGIFRFLPWMIAIGFEGAMAAMIHRLSDIIATDAPATKKFLNIYTFAVVMFVSVSFVANVSYAWVNINSSELPQGLDQAYIYFAYFAGGVLPLAAGFFAFILAKEQKVDSQLEAENKQLTARVEELKAQVREVNSRTKAVNPLLPLADKNGKKKDKILVLHNMFPNAPQNAIAGLLSTSPAFVSRTLENKNGSSK